MYYGGQHFGAGAGAGVLNSYADGVNIHSDLLPNEPKRSHMATLHATLLLHAPLIMGTARPIPTARSPKPRITISLTSYGCIRLGFHSFRILCAKRTNMFACFSPIIKEGFIRGAWVLTAVRDPSSSGHWVVLGSPRSCIGLGGTLPCKHYNVIIITCNV